MKQKLFLCVVMLTSAFMMTSCGSHKPAPDLVIPQAINTINSVGLRELNLKHETDFLIMNTVSAEATVIYTVKKKGKNVVISEENDEFKIEWKYDEQNCQMYVDDYEGIARFGFLSNDYGRTFTKEIAPEYIVRNLAIYRLINQAKVRGADGVIEPVISTNVESRGKDIVFKASATAKLMKLNADAK